MLSFNYDSHSLQYCLYMSSSKHTKHEQSNPLKIPIAKHSPKLDPLIVPTSKSSSQLLNKLLNEKIPQLNLPVCSSIQEAADIYYREYNKLFLQNEEINNKLIEVISDRNNLADKFNHIKKAKSSQDYVKRKRREAKDIEREFFCPIEKCKKGYGSEGSLTHHVRLKHKEYYESGVYEIFLQQYIEKMSQMHREKDDGRVSFKKEEEIGHHDSSSYPHFKH